MRIHTLAECDMMPPGHPAAPEPKKIGIQALPLCPICICALKYDFGELHCENGHASYKFIT